jgi:hypothetical protein
VRDGIGQDISKVVMRMHRLIIALGRVALSGRRRKIAQHFKFGHTGKIGGRSSICFRDF